MTKRDKVVLFCAGLLAILVVAGTLVYWLGSDGPATGPALMFVVSIELGAGSIWIIYRTRIRKDRGEEQLDAQYHEAYHAVRDAIGTSQMRPLDRKEIQEDVLDLMLSAQRDGKRVENAIGTPEKFAAEIIQAGTRPKRRLGLDVLDGCIAFLLMVLGSGLLLWLEEGGLQGQPISIVRQDLMMLEFFAVVSFVLIPVTRRLVAGGHPWAYLVPLGGGVLMVLTAELARQFLYWVYFVQVLLDGRALIFQDWVMPILIGVAVPLLIGVKALIRRRRVQ